MHRSVRPGAAEADDSPATCPDAAVLQGALAAMAMAAARRQGPAVAEVLAMDAARGGVPSPARQDECPPAGSDFQLVQRAPVLEAPGA